MMTKNNDYYLGWGLLIISVVLFFSSFTIEDRAGTRIGPRMMPQLVCLLLSALSILMIILNKAKNKSNDVTKINMKQFLFAVIPLIIYIVFLERVGFILMSIVYLTSQFYLFSESKTIKRLLYYIFLSSVIVSITSYLFISVFQLLLPMGWFEFIEYW